MLGRVATEEGLAAMLASVEGWLTHLLALPPIAAPPGLCSFCAGVIVGPGVHCAHCGTHFHKQCLSRMGCPLPGCTSPERIIDGIVSISTQGGTWEAMAETRKATSRDFEGADAAPS
jgi:hypothetical protein